MLVCFWGVPRDIVLKTWPCARKSERHRTTLITRSFPKATLKRKPCLDPQLSFIVAPNYLLMTTLYCSPYLPLNEKHKRPLKGTSTYRLRVLCK